MDEVLLKEIQVELERLIDSAQKRSPQSFFKEAVKSHGVKTYLVDRVSAGSFKKVADRTKPEVFSLCEGLLMTDYVEESFVAFDWAYRLRERFEPADFEVFERWLARYVNNWAKCDTLCNHTVAAFIERYPRYVDRLKAWARSENRWLRRGAAVALVLPARKGMFLEDVFEIADILLADEEDLVQKGYGWMLKEAGKLHQREVFEYVMGKKAVMPRTALRYAIEKMPEELKRRAMERGKPTAQSTAEAVARAQKTVRKHVSEGISLVDELTRERREEVSRE